MTLGANLATTRGRLVDRRAQVADVARVVRAGPWQVALAMLVVGVVVTSMLDDPLRTHLLLGLQVVAASTAAVCCFGRARVAPRPRTALVLMGAAATTWAFGFAIELVARLVADAGTAVDQLVAGAVVISRLVVIAAFAAVPIIGSRWRRVRTVLDLTTIVAAVLISVVAVRLRWAEETAAPEVAAIAIGPVLSLLAVGIAGATLTRATSRWRLPLLLSWIGVAGFVAGDLVVAAHQALGHDGLSAVAALGWLGGWFLIAIGVSVPVRDDPFRSVRDEPDWTSTIVTASTFALLIVVEATGRTASEHTTLMVLILLGFAVVLVRSVAFQIESASLHRTVRAQALEASERAERYEEALQATGAGIWEYDVAADCFWSSRGLDQLLERHRTGPEPLTSFLDSVTEPMRPQVRAAIEQAVASDEALTMQTVRRTGGSERHLETRGRPRQRGAGVVYSGVVIDVTERRRAELAVEQQARRADALAALGRRALSADGVDPVVWDALEVIADHLDPRTCRLLRCESAGASLRQVAMLGAERDVDELLARNVLLGATTEVVRPAAGRSASNGVVALVPIVARTGTWGVIEVALAPGHEFTDVEASFVEAVASTVSRAVSFDATQRELRHHVLHDQLTGLPNRALLVDRIGQLLRSRPGSEIVVVHVGLDRFGSVNDSFGHAGGDAVLVEIARRLARVCSSGGSTGRVSGDEFVIAAEVDDREVDDLVTDVRTVVGRPVLVDDTDVVVTASIGVARRVYGTSAEMLLANAATASNLASRQGGDRARHFDDGDRAESVERIRLASELRHALRTGQIVPWYQPIVRIADRRVVCAEALARWDRPGAGIVPPDRFVPVAEEAGLICGVGRTILAQALDDLRRWRTPDGGSPCITVNVATQQLVDGSIVDALRDEFERTGIDPARVGIEIVEGEIADDRADAALRTIRRIKELGDVKISVDDFGTGHSSLSRLHQFPVDKVKIDRTFVAQIEADPAERALVQAIIDMGRALSLEVVAEGVETEAQLAILADMGCTYAQGWLFAPALPFDDLLALPLSIDDVDRTPLGWGPNPPRVDASADAGSSSLPDPGSGMSTE